MSEHYLTNKSFKQQIAVKFYTCTVDVQKMCSIKLEVLVADLLGICV